MKVVCIGEVLWDNLPHGMFLGGAPLNVATNLRKLGVDAQILSAIGNDELGKKTLVALTDIGFDFTTIQKNERPTGLVEVELNDRGIPTYTINEHSAWDYIEATDSATDLVAQADLVVIGSLSSRNIKSANAISELLNAIKGTCVVDVNFRKPYYDEALIDLLLSHANILKVNDEEIEEIAGWKSLNADFKVAVPELCDTHKIDKAFITLGDEGAAFYCDKEFVLQPRFEVEVADTVGAGDAFLAGALFSIIQQKDPTEVLKFANAMGAYVASKKGATPELVMDEIESLFTS